MNWMEAHPRVWRVVLIVYYLGVIAGLGHREPEMLVAFLGAVKSGRPYVPIDTALPQQRIDKVLEIARPALLLTADETARLAKNARQAAPNGVQSDEPFYILFTSG